MAYTLVTAPTVEPVTLAQAKDHLRVSTNTEDTLIASLNRGARAWIETYLRRALITQTWKLTLDCFPAVIEINKCPVTSITHVKYYNTSGTLTTLTVNTDYVVDLTSEPARIVPAYGVCWPSTRSGLPAQVEVQFVCGYGSAGNTVPDTIISAIKELTAYWFENREGAESHVPMSIKGKLSNYRNFRF